MKEFIKKLLDESTNYSTQRFALLFTLFLNLCLSTVVCVLCFQMANIIYITALIELITFTFGISLTGKVVQRFAEKNNEENK